MNDQHDWNDFSIDYFASNRFISIFHLYEVDNSTIDEDESTFMGKMDKVSEIFFVRSNSNH